MTESTKKNKIDKIIDMLHEVKIDVGDFKKEIKADIVEIKADIVEFKKDVSKNFDEIKLDIVKIKADIVEFKKEVDANFTEIKSLPTIQKELKFNNKYQK